MAQQPSLKRAVGLPGATMMGFGSILGTGAFVSLGLGAGLIGPFMIFALLLAGILALCNALSTAQLAAAHPMSGGSYEYGYKYVNGWVGFLAGWMFLCAKSASAAAAALGFGSYFAQIFKLDFIPASTIGLLTVMFVVVVAVLGIRRSTHVNTAIVTLTLASLGMFVLATSASFQVKHFSHYTANLTGSGGFSEPFLEATALMFVAYTGYGRVATLGEEITHPSKNIPKAIILTLVGSFLIYMSIALVAMGAIGSQKYYYATIEKSAPLQNISQAVNHPTVTFIVSIGAMSAMLGVLLNLVLGLSRVIFAMGRKGDLPTFLAKVIHSTHAPAAAIFTSGCMIAALVLMDDIKIAWSFSAFTVLIYYTITNVAALKLPIKHRIYPRSFAWIGLIGCIALSFWVERGALILGVSILTVGLTWRLCYQKLKLFKNKRHH